MFLNRPACPKCGKRNTQGRMFCATCGARLPASDHDARAQPALSLDPAAAEDHLPDLAPEDHRPPANPLLFGLAVLATGALLLLVGLLTFGSFGSFGGAGLAAVPTSTPLPAAVPTPSALATQAAAPPTATPHASPTSLSDSAVVGTATVQAARETARYATGTTSALSATARVAEARTTVARDMLPTIQAVQIPSATPYAGPVRVLSLAAVPAYPGARPVQAEDPFLQGANPAPAGAADPLDRVRQRIEYGAYVLPAGETLGAVYAFYQRMLPASQWQLHREPSAAELDPSVQQQTFVWTRPQQRLVLTMMTGGAQLQEDADGGSYLLLTLVTQTGY